MVLAIVSRLFLFVSARKEHNMCRRVCYIAHYSPIQEMAIVDTSMLYGR